MGQRANLFEEARNTINVLKSKAASKQTYERNFPMSIMRVTRRHLHNVSIELIDAFEKNRYISIPALMKRYYKVNQLHISQLRKNLKMCTTTESKILEHNKMYLLQLSQMFSKLFKQICGTSSRRSGLFLGRSLFLRGSLLSFLPPRVALILSCSETAVSHLILI